MLNPLFGKFWGVSGSSSACPKVHLGWTYLSMADEKVIFTMTGVTKHFEKKPVFRDISLSYFYSST